MTYNPEAGLPITGDSEWEHPDIVNRMWNAGEIQLALTNFGFTPYAYDPNMREPCACKGEWEECPGCNGEGTIPLVLRRNKRWVKDDLALRVPNDPTQIVSPYLGACVSALFA